MRTAAARSRTESSSLTNAKTFGEAIGAPSEYLVLATSDARGLEPVEMRPASLLARGDARVSDRVAHAPTVSEPSDRSLLRR